MGDVRNISGGGRNSPKICLEVRRYQRRNALGSHPEAPSQYVTLGRRHHLLLSATDMSSDAICFCPEK